tara:strand:- start:387 stop:1856 length:1470 start_codon:yes stop_codon:yes gene_type:complete
MASKTETLNLNVKSDVGKVGEDAKNAAGEFRIMGVSLNSVKSGFLSAGKQAKTMFASVKAGLISTGIGAFLVAIGSLVSYFTNTKRGADQLEKALAGMGAVVDVIVDRFSKFGEVLTFVFSGEFQKAGDALKETFSGIADEIEREVVAMTELKRRTQELRDADLEFMVQKAATRQEIERARLIAEDESKSAKERLENLKVALDLEEKTTQRELELARERLAIQKEEMAQSENLIEDEEKLASLKVELIEKETASIKMRRRVVTEVNALEREIHAEEQARLKERQEAFDERFGEIEKMPGIVAKVNNELIQADNDYLKNYLASNEAIKKSDEAVKQNKLQVTAAIGQAIGALGGLFREGSAAAKAAALTEIAIGTGVGFIQGLDIAQKSSKAAGPGAAFAFPLFYATQVMAVLNAAAQAKSILGAGGGGGGGNVGGSPQMVPQTPAPQMMSGAFELGGGLAPEATKAFVVTDEMTNSQNQLANIRRQATI